MPVEYINYKNHKNHRNHRNDKNHENTQIKCIRHMDSIFYYIPNFLSNRQQQELTEWLDSMRDLQDAKAFNKKRSRLQKWYQEDNSYFCPQWKQRYDRWISFKYDSKLKKIQNNVQEYVNTLKNIDDITIPKINSCLINKYRDGKDYIKAHRDTELSFGEDPTIIGLSLGASRDICFKRVVENKDNKNNYTRKHDKDNQHLNFTQTLESGSMFIMAGASQRLYTHEILKSDEMNPRYSLTFREYINSG